MRIRTRWTMYRPGVRLSRRAIWARPDIRADITTLCAEIAALGGVTTEEAIANVREFYQALGGRP